MEFNDVVGACIPVEVNDSREIRAVLHEKQGTFGKLVPRRRERMKLFKIRQDAKILVVAQRIVCHQPPGQRHHRLLVH